MKNRSLCQRRLEPPNSKINASKKPAKESAGAGRWSCARGPRVRRLQPPQCPPRGGRAWRSAPSRLGPGPRALGEPGWQREGTLLRQPRHQRPGAGARGRGQARGGGVSASRAPRTLLPTCHSPSSAAQTGDRCPSGAPASTAPRPGRSLPRAGFSALAASPHPSPLWPMVRPVRPARPRPSRRGPMVRPVRPVPPRLALRGPMAPACPARRAGRAGKGRLRGTLGAAEQVGASGCEVSWAATRAPGGSRRKQPASYWPGGSRLLGFPTEAAAWAPRSLGRCGRGAGVRGEEGRGRVRKTRALLVFAPGAPVVLGCALGAASQGSAGFKKWDPMIKRRQTLSSAAGFRSVYLPARRQRGQRPQAFGELGGLCLSGSCEWLCDFCFISGFPVLTSGWTSSFLSPA